MKTKSGFLALIAIAVLSVSCATGRYMEMKQSDRAEVLGTVQSTFLVNGSFRYRRTINQQAYISLLTEAQNKYPDIVIDVRDISWAIGAGDAANNNYEYSAVGKIIKLSK